MAQHNEIAFENELCAYLKATGWLYSESDKGYDKALALFPEDVLAWLEESQPEEYYKAVDPQAAAATQEQAKQNIVKRLADSLSKDIEKVGGTLRVLRSGFKNINHKFDMMQAKPALELNPETMRRYEAMRLRVIRQVHYSTKNNNSIDLVFFVNGIPVATAELKTDFTQTVQDAINQYKYDRQPAGEPLLSFGTRAVVHFALSNTEVHMTTKLAGPHTVFLPFNKGDNGRAGNPLNEYGSPTAYLWEEVFQKDTWLTILHKFMHLETTVDVDPDTGKKAKSQILLFPRYHQLRVVNKLIEAVREEGPGQRYLIQHSAGSGKTNSIAWTAHRLASLHNEQNQKVFDAVIVVTDRTVLDKQLQDAIGQLDHKSGLVLGISKETGGPKSDELVKALQQGVQIIIVTIQTFIPTLEKIRGTQALAAKNFAIIADEAHSSQTGSTSGALKKVLTTEELQELEDGSEIDTDMVLAAAMQNDANAKNLSFFAFTATPKAKTIELFGRIPVEESLPEAFDVYTMQQAIEEGFILDVLQNYTPYKVAFKLALEGLEYTDDDEVDSSHAKTALMKWVKENPESIAKKIEVIVEHFRQIVSRHLNGEAKAMIVTSSRKEAVRYKLAFDKYLQEQGYGYKALVAFSGEVTDPELGVEPFSEANMNKETKGQDLAQAFKTKKFRFMIVANKYQTGFDQPKLVAMYVDKKLSGVAAVQTLSRLNRMHKNKAQTFVLDFVNDPQQILESFQPYYREAKLADTTDPNLIHDLKIKLDSELIYNDLDVVALSDAFIRNEGNNVLMSKVQPAANLFTERWKKSEGDKDEQGKLLLFKSDVAAFLRLYNFMSQLIDYQDTDLYRLAIYLKHLLPLLKTTEEKEPIDLSAVDLTYFNVKKQDPVSLVLDGEGALTPITGLGTGMIREEHRSRLEEIIQQINELFSAEEFEENDVRSTMYAVLSQIRDNKELQTQARNNTEAQFKQSNLLRKASDDALVKVYTQSPKVVAAIFERPEIKELLAAELPLMLLEALRQKD